ncbi:MAG: hypothetical protein HKO05_03500 [Erythrobacter sp.]|jgi:hypothetical protein|nr:hypothetical protein [Erythrobacter sp.]
MRNFLAALVLLVTSIAAYAQSDEWFLGSHPDYHAAMVRDIDGIFVALYVAKKPTVFGSPLLMETVAPACNTKRPIEMHETEAIMALGATPEDRLKVVRASVQRFYDSSVKPCPPTKDLETKLFHRFDDAYLAMDAMLIEANVFPLSSDEDAGNDNPDVGQEDSLK